MSKIKTNSNKFWKVNSNGKTEIIQRKLIDFLTESGFSKAETSKIGYIFVLVNDNTVKEIAEYTIVDYIKKYLKKINELDVLEVFSKGLSGYISKPKLQLLDTVKLINDRDDEKSSIFYFRNICCQVNKNSILEIEYKYFKGKIWESRILPHNFRVQLINSDSQFKKFCYNIAGQDDKRFLSLQSIIGYLLHRYNNPGNPRAIIFLDEKISYDGSANGGTGKSLLVSAIGKCRELVVMDGKNIKTASVFKNQRINRTTDVVFFDDVTKEFSLESLYSMITTGVVVEKKHKNEEKIEPENAPKICISSNYVVAGTGGNTDIRRRCEFEVSNHYSGQYTPEDEFGNLFFEGWDDEEWSNFYFFMMLCVQIYLKHGLIVPNPINLKKNKLINATSQEFVAFMETNVVEIDKWHSKKDVLELFKSEYPYYKNLSSHLLTKWFKEYTLQTGLIYEDRSSGGKYEFYLKKTDGDGKK